jgi:hypothetical protein
MLLWHLALSRLLWHLGLSRLLWHLGLRHLGLSRLLCAVTDCCGIWA